MEITSDCIKDYLTGKDLLTLWSKIKYSKSKANFGVPVVSRSDALDLINTKLHERGLPSCSELVFNELARLFYFKTGKKLNIKSKGKHIRADTGILEKLIAYSIAYLTKPDSYLVATILTNSYVWVSIIPDQPNPQAIYDEIEIDYLRKQQELWKKRHLARLAKNKTLQSC